LIKSEALSTGANDTLSCRLGESKSADRHLGAFQHTDIVSDLSDNNSGLSILVGHVFGKTVKANRGLIDLAHVKTLQYCGAKLGISSSGQKLVQLDQKTVVRVLGLDNLHGALMPRAASSGFQINTHFVVC
jgi:hypothetical protein